MDVICLGEAVIDLIASEPVVSIADASSFVPVAGGSPANTAVALARLGLRTGFVGKVGDDPFGQHLGRILGRNGVDTSRLLFDRTARTALAFVALDEVGHPDFVCYRHPSADMLLGQADLDPGYLTSARVLHTGSAMLAAEPCRSTTVEAMRLARAADRLVSLDPNVRRSLWEGEEELRRVVLPLLELADIVKLSEEDLAALVGESEPYRGSLELLACGPKLVIVTRGQAGCFCRNARNSLPVPGYRVPVVDTTGAGDAFAAGLLAGLLALDVSAGDLPALGEEMLHPVLRLANAVGALATTVRGAIPALPDRAALRSLLIEQGQVGALELLDFLAGLPRRR
ncbi:MAG: hypothetical protein HYY04_01685 [Chloroflexi bacterium]|nr:hypothetical protein [Chloroflexota bacterium]